ncbi:MAG: hypothetical protein A2527_13635 [Candidatus Lambdaproteobacteria bacterium RIFOXYD2_FULL_50_16]|uniref:cysteine desulfurase n=1 Tax=Candidatus Lambdaproteobacteria bacterium RIFOXYD2_FULL_50_16 TaxID=1817772 RepID=A0A1F6G5A1_9PROT|nr:MAG: hypothetical protein A2527_13635 [Candidatus Lambdaproteobacteria bacterium RIFOXYD2_FULL_50_16]
MRNKIHLDYAASTPLDRRVLEAMAPGFEFFAANPSAIHGSARSAEQVWVKGKERIANLLGVRRADLIITSGGTESNHLGLLGYLKTLPGGHILVNPGEHVSVRRPLEELAKQANWSLEWLKVDPFGQVDLEQAERQIKADTKLLVVQWASNETGLLQPIERLASLTQKKGVTFFSDASQAALTEVLKPKDLGVDLMTLSGHKIYGPKGVGLLYKREGLNMAPLMWGGGQEYGLRPGTENLSGLLGLAKAMTIANDERNKRRAHFEKLSSLLYQGLEDAGRAIVPPELPRVPHIHSFLFPDRRAHNLLMRLDLLGIEASSGSACSVGMEEPSPGMMALGLNPEEALSVLRFSFGVSNQESEIMQVIEDLWEILGST